VDEWQVLDEDRGMDRYVVHALFCLVLDHVEEILRGDLFELLLHLHCLIDRDRTDWHRRRVDDRLANRVDVAAG
jgi:hypothetical protein